MGVLIALLMVDLTVKEKFSMFHLRHADFCCLGVNVHDGLIGQFFLFYVGVFLDCDGVGSVYVIGIPRSYSTHVHDYISQFMFYYLLPRPCRKN